MSREELLEQLDRTAQWDIIIIGGGATGLGIALEAVSRGYKTLLLEQSDFAKSTSSKSTKLIHGGVRYLAQGHVGLVREASVERGILLRNAPHLVKNQTFIIPLYSQWDAFKYTVGLKLYDWIAGKLSLGSSTFISRKKVVDSLPNINEENLIGGVLYHDGRFDDARLAINLAQSVIDHGGTVLNYVKVSGLIKNAAGHISGVEASDIESKKHFRIGARVTINATGVFADDILQMDKAESDKTIQVSQGTHVVLDKKFFPSANAMMIPKTSDGRVLFVIPWYDKILVGTTDTPVPNVSLEPTPSEKEIDFILSTASIYLKEKPRRENIVSVFAGLRPLAAQKEESIHTKEISRNYKIIVSSSNLFTIVGGKWTTYRKMGEHMITKIETKLNWNKTVSVTNSLHLHGWHHASDTTNPLAFYGSDEGAITQMIKESPYEWISEKLFIHKAQIKWAMMHEMARTVEDILGRRTRALLLDARESLRISAHVAQIMAEELGKDKEWIQQQVKEYASLVKKYLV